ncbi:uncharacterized protein LOC120279183 [Dioscorea cayenensis subsp. rotundata]|uniref:Uncharacterized protein LOC120279183 n=1 Tax=Dioscorea cayennensis subsp. rotundata TaxID=55577 RepID=A0AB40CPH0_DIOCR|nr:uncharacterized protein LOC120279183 [Dioscorea cayenensis subsp. rotundata]
MASGGHAPHPVVPPDRPQSWAQVASSNPHSSDTSPLQNPLLLAKLKSSTSQFVRIDGDALARAHLKFQNSLFGKFFGKPPPFDQVKAFLSAKWSQFGEVLISDLPNGFLLLRCDSHDTLKHLLCDGPWSINGIILQLSPWEPFFEPAFAKLSTAAVWVQLHNLPVEFWDGNSLEMVTAHLGNLLKIDELTASLSRSKFARVCLEIDLAKPLNRGFWIGDESHRVFVVVLYERLPTFCYSCGVIGHGSKNCSHSTTTGDLWCPSTPSFRRGS